MLIQLKMIKILWVGSDTDRKNHILLKKIIYSICEIDEKVIFNIVVSENMIEGFKELKTKYPKNISLYLTMSKNKFYKLIKSSNYLICTSFREVNSVLILESLSLGIPVFSTKFPGTIDTISDNDFLFSWNDSPDSIAKKILNYKLKNQENNKAIRNRIKTIIKLQHKNAIDKICKLL